MFGIKIKNNITLLLIVITTLLVLSITGCINNQSNTNEIPSSSNADLTGIWSAQFYEGTMGHVTDMIFGSMYISKDNMGYLLISDPMVNNYGRLGAAGKFNSLGGSITASLTIYNSSGMPSGTLTIKDASIHEDHSTGKTIYIFEGKYNGDAEPFTDSGLFSMVAENQTTPSMSKISRNWYFSEPDGETRFYIDSTGVITGGNDFGGVFNGSIGIVDSNYDLYEINDFKINNLGDPWDGNYRGLATLPNPTSLKVIILKTDESFGFIMQFGYRE